MGNSTQNMSEAQFWHAPLEFVVHATVGTLIFGIVAIPAIFLDRALNMLEAHGIGIVIIAGLKMAEYALFGSDLCLFFIFLWRTAKRISAKL
jgi:hypothetical protein